jgi:hypothetical protein
LCDKQSSQLYKPYRNALCISCAYQNRKRLAYIFCNHICVFHKILPALQVSPSQKPVKSVEQRGLQLGLWHHTVKTNIWKKMITLKKIEKGSTC